MRCAIDYSISMKKFMVAHITFDTQFMLNDALWWPNPDLRMTSEYVAMLGKLWACSGHTQSTLVMVVISIRNITAIPIFFFCPNRPKRPSKLLSTAPCSASYGRVVGKHCQHSAKTSPDSESSCNCNFDLYLSCGVQEVVLSGALSCREFSMTAFRSIYDLSMTVYL